MVALPGAGGAVRVRETCRSQHLSEAHRFKRNQKLAALSSRTGRLKAQAKLNPASAGFFFLSHELEPRSLTPSPGFVAHPLDA